MKKYVRIASFTQQTIRDISTALINDEGDSKTVQYALRTHQDANTLPLELWANGQHRRTIFLVPDGVDRQLTPQTMEIINTQAELLFREASQYGIKDPAGVQRILGAITNGYGDQEFYPGVIKKAAAYWYKYATAQMFHNGNKRTALVAGLYYLFINGFLLTAIDGNALAQMTVDVANQLVTQAELEQYISAKVRLNYFSSLAEAQAYVVDKLTTKFTRSGEATATLEFDQGLLEQMAATQRRVDQQHQANPISEQQVQADIEHFLQVEPVKTAITLLAAE